MSASMINKLTLACRQCLQINSRCVNVAFRDYNSKRNRIKFTASRPNPRKDVQYPYVPGDPHHEELIQKLDKNKIYFDPAVQKKARDLTQISDTLRHNRDRQVKDNRHTTQYGHIYEKIKDGDVRLGKTILRAKSSKESDSDTIVLEGYRLIKDAICLGAEIKYLYFSTEDLLKDLPPSFLQDTQIFKIPHRDMRIWSDTTTPSGILGIFKKPEMGGCCYSSEEPRLPLTVILDCIKDPGNVGTLIRTAAAIGCERILVLKGCANVWQGKVLRSGMGGHFSIPIYHGLTWSQVSSFMEESTHVFLADARTEDDVVNDFDQRLSVEQINNDTDSESESSSSDSEIDDSSNNAKTMERNDVFSRLSFPVTSYSNTVLYPSKSGATVTVALVIGSETEGLSPAAKKFAYDYYGKFLTVPMSPAVDSLNTAVAGSIILYEIRRKMLECATPKDRDG